MTVLVELTTTPVIGASWACDADLTTSPVTQQKTLRSPLDDPTTSWSSVLVNVIDRTELSPLCLPAKQLVTPYRHRGQNYRSKLESLIYDLLFLPISTMESRVS